MALVLATTGTAALIQSITGFGFALLLAPVASVIVGPRNTVTLVTVLGLATPLSMAVHLRRHILVRPAVTMIAASALGMPIGLTALIHAPREALQVLIASLVLLSVWYLWTNPAFGRAGTRLDLTAGVIAGAMSTSTGTNGPPVVLALHTRRVRPDEFRATVSTCFAVMNMMVITLFVASGQLRTAMLPTALAGLPILALGYVAGAAVRRRIDQRQFRSMVLGLLTVSAFAAIVGALA